MLFRGGSEKPWFPWAGSKGYAFRVNNLFPTSSPLQIAWPCRDDAQQREGGLSVDLLMLSVPRGQRPALNTRGKMVSQMAAKHLCRLQPSPAFLPSAFLTHCRNLIMNSFHLSGERADERHCWNCVSVSWTYLKQTAGRLLSFLSLKVETMLTTIIFFYWTLKPQTFLEQVWWVLCPGPSTVGVSKKLTALSLSQQMRIGNPADC